MVWKAGAIFTVLKYASLVAVIGFLTYSVISSYTLRETIGELKAELRLVEETNERVIRQVLHNERRLEHLRQERREIWRDIDALRDETDEDVFWDTLFDRLRELGREDE